MVYRGTTDFVKSLITKGMKDGCPQEELTIHCRCLRGEKFFYSSISI